MIRKDDTITVSDGKTLALSRWTPDPAIPLRGVVQIAHGKAEHRKRYDGFARFLTDNGFIAVANDHRGHGESIAAPQEKGSFPAHEGWTRVVHDLIELKKSLQTEFPDIPFFLFGHSMGSFLMRNVILEDSQGVSGVILSGTTFSQGLLGRIGMIVANREIRKKGGDTPSDLLESMASGSFNKPFRPNRTPFDWLSRDEAVVDAYAADPLCGFSGSGVFYRELLKGIQIICDQYRVDLLPPELPIYLFSGSLDPVGGFTKAVEKTWAQYRKAGIKDLTLKFYPEGRHEMLNELNKEEVYADVLAWMEGRI